jgi:hypothetical protein
MRDSASLLRDSILSRTVWLFLVLLGDVAAVTTLLPPATAIAQQQNDAKLSDKVDMDFESFELDKIPAGFVPILGGMGKEVSWVVKTEPSAPSGTKVLAQTSVDELDLRFPLLLYDELIARDVDVMVQFKTISGQIEQVAGIIVRFQDQHHFYVVRASAFENNVRLYKIVNGVPQPIAGENVKVSSGEWHTLRVAVRETRFHVFFEEQSLFETDDTTFAAGKVGLSTEADSVTVFDNLHIESHDAGTDIE